MGHLVSMTPAKHIFVDAESSGLRNTPFCFRICDELIFMSDLICPIKVLLSYYSVFSFSPTCLVFLADSNFKVSWRLLSCALTSLPLDLFSYKLRLICYIFLISGTK